MIEPKNFENILEEIHSKNKRIAKKKNYCEMKTACSRGKTSNFFDFFRFFSLST